MCFYKALQLLTGAMLEDIQNVQNIQNLQNITTARRGLATSLRESSASSRLARHADALRQLTNTAWSDTSKLTVQGTCDNLQFERLFNCSCQSSNRINKPRAIQAVSGTETPALLVLLKLTQTARTGGGDSNTTRDSRGSPRVCADGLTARLACAEHPTASHYRPTGAQAF